MIYSWDETKNRYLSLNRNISFERILVALEEGDILQVLQNPNQDKYKDQKIYVLKFDNYAWVVPFRDAAEKADSNYRLSQQKIYSGIPGR